MPGEGAWIPWLLQFCPSYIKKKEKKKRNLFIKFTQLPLGYVNDYFSPFITLIPYEAH